MRAATKFLFLILIAVSIIVEADVKFTYTWKSPEAQPVIFAGKKVAVVLVTSDRAGRRAAEESLARELRERGVVGVASSSILTESEIKDPNLTKTRFKEEGVAGAMVIRATPMGGGTVDPDMWKDPIYKDVWGFTSKSWKLEESTGMPKEDVRFTVEVSVYSTEQEQMIWLGKTEMKSSKLSEFIQTIVDEIAEEMVKAGLLTKTKEG